MKFTLSTDSGERVLTSALEIEEALIRLIRDNGAFLTLVPESKIDGFTYIQAAFIQKTKGFFKKTVVSSFYLMEVQEERPNGDLMQYSMETRDLSAVRRLFYDFFERQTVPELSGWECELFYKAGT